jgi:peptidylprolyl isomerase
MRKAVALAAVLGPLIVGCGGGEGSPPVSAEVKATFPATTTPASNPGPPVELPGGPEPKKLIVEDLKRGTGAEARFGKRLYVRYVGVYWNGKPVANAWTYPVPVNFPLGSQEIMSPGLNRGMNGMRVGGRRQITVPERLWDYPGPQAAEGGQGLPGERTYVYVVDLLKVAAD